MIINMQKWQIYDKLWLIVIKESIAKTAIQFLEQGGTKYQRIYVRCKLLRHKQTNKQAAVSLVPGPIINV